VKPGVDRVVVVGAKTYLDGEVQTLGEAETAIEWKKESGPGDVAFEDASKAATTATFSAPGEYTLAFTARDGDLSTTGNLLVKVVASPEGKPLLPVQTGYYRITNPISVRAASTISRTPPRSLLDSPPSSIAATSSRTPGSTTLSSACAWPT
jgi:hypothetical protein